MQKPSVIFLLVLSFAFFAQSCATYSHLRPAHTLEQHHMELSLGAASGAVGTNFLAKAHYGILDRLEAHAQYETYSGHLGLRYMLIGKDSPFALNLGAQVGTYYREFDFIDPEDDWYNGYAPMLTVGYRAEPIEVYSAYTAYFSKDRHELHAMRLGLRWTHPKEKFFIGAEGGLNLINDGNKYDDFFEGALNVGFVFDLGAKKNS